jgi:hypothetical protein
MPKKKKKNNNKKGINSQTKPSNKVQSNGDKEK